MNRKFLVLGVAVISLFAFIAFGVWGGSHWDDHTQVTRIVPGANGETLVISDNGNRGFFPFFPFFFFIPVLWFLVIGCVFTFFGRRRWTGGPAFGPPTQGREAWLADWHRTQHAGTPSPSSSELSSQESPGSVTEPSHPAE